MGGKRQTEKNRCQMQGGTAWGKKTGLPTDCKGVWGGGHTVPGLLEGATAFVPKKTWVVFELRKKEGQVDLFVEGPKKRKRKKKKKVILRALRTQYQDTGQFSGDDKETKWRRGTERYMVKLKRIPKGSSPYGKKNR